MQMKQSLLRSPSRRYRRSTPCYILKHKISFTHLEALESSHRRSVTAFATAAHRHSLYYPWPNWKLSAILPLRTYVQDNLSNVKAKNLYPLNCGKSVFFQSYHLNRFVLRQQTADLGIGWQPHAAQPIPPGYRGLPSAGASPQANGEHGGAEEASRGAVKYVPAAGAPLWDLSAKADFPWTVSTPAVRIHCTPGQTVSCRSTNRSRRPCRVEK